MDGKRETVSNMIHNDQWENVIDTLELLPKDQREALWSEIVQNQLILPDKVQDYLIQESIALTALCHRKISYERLLQIQKKSPMDHDGMIVFGSCLLRGEENDCSLERFVRDHAVDESIMEEMLNLWESDFSERKHEFLQLTLQTCKNEKIRKIAERQMLATSLCKEEDLEKIQRYAESSDPLVLLALSCNPNVTVCVLDKLMKTKGVKYAKEIRLSARKNLKKGRT